METTWRYMGQDYRLDKVRGGYDIYKVGVGWVAWTAGSISDAHDTVRSMANTPAVLTDKPERIALTAPYSEVCMHLRVAGTQVLVEPRPRGMAQLYTADGDPISFPITRGEAGLHPTLDAPFATPCLNESQAGTGEQDDEDELLDRLLLRFPAENRVDPMKPGRAQ